MNVKRNLTALMIGSEAVLVLFAGGCSTDDAGGPTAEPTESTESTAAAVSPTAAMAVADSPGHALFIAKGCAACHGQNAEGTSIAPALPGHNEQSANRCARTLPHEETGPAQFGQSSFTSRSYIPA